MKDFFEKCEAAYFSGYPIISDEEYDALVKKWNHESVGHKVTDGVPHLYKMYSLQKVFDLDDIPPILQSMFVLRSWTGLLCLYCM